MQQQSSAASSTTTTTTVTPVTLVLRRKQAPTSAPPPTKHEHIEWAPDVVEINEFSGKRKSKSEWNETAMTARRRERRDATGMTLPLMPA